MVTEARIVVCTDNLAGSDLIRKNFAAHTDPKFKTKGIMVIGDEDGQASEANTWIPVVGLDEAMHVKGSIHGGDRFQLPPSVISAFGNEKYNGFGEQLGRSLFDRLLRSKFPSVMLCRQHWMHPRISAFPSKYTYNGLLKNDVSTSNIIVPSRLKLG